VVERPDPAEMVEVVDTDNDEFVEDETVDVSEDWTLLTDAELEEASVLVASLVKRLLEVPMLLL
jgi:hypothetical protein